MNAQDIQTFVQTCGVVFAAIALGVNAFFSYRRLVHDEHTRNLAATENLYNLWTDADMRSGMEFVEKELQQKYQSSLGFRDLPDEARRAVVSVSHICDRIAARVISGEANENAVATMLGAKLVQLWEIMQPYIEVERKRPDSVASDLRGHFEAVAKKFKALNLPKLRKERVAKYLARK